ncbi:hypothetical protein, partial [Bifidobacterium actinocoloniiforme]|uniref:RCC1 domain-containing protein n=1 Tax=Bifidobacterium actinocoloniiforme TaxID=638619 RepID=UPI00068DAC72
TDGNTYAWGRNDYGELGDDTRTDRNTPVRVHTPAGVRFTSVSAGNEFSLAIGSDGHAYSWGYNGSGQLGNDTSTYHRTPEQVHAPTNGDNPANTWKTISAGYWHSLAIGSDGHAYSWGANGYGQLGDGSNDVSDRPEQVHAPTNGGNPANTWKTISAGDQFSLAIGSDGHAYSWGANDYGQLGNGTNTRSNRPEQVHAPDSGNPANTWKTISTGGSRSLAIGSDDHAYSWGANYCGQLGNGSSDDNPHSRPEQVHAPTNGGNPANTWKTISAGGYHSLATGSDGHAYSWGWNWHGELGDGSIYGRSTPALIGHKITVTGATFEPTNAPTPTWNPTTHTWDTTSPTHPEGQATVTIHWTLDGVTQTDYPINPYEYYHLYTLPKAGGAPTQQLAGATLLTLTTLTALTLTSHHITRKHHHTHQPTTTSK